jgi:hypothetical protein
VKKRGYGGLVTRMNTAWACGEPVWMTADAMIQFWQGSQLASKDDSESSRRILRDAIRRQS